MEYQTTYRRTEFTIPALLAVLVLFGLGAYLSLLQLPDSDAVMTSIFWDAGLTLVAIILIFANCYRVHRWMIEARGLCIAERSKVPLMGLRRRAEVRYDEIAAVYRLESGFDRYVDVVTRGGRLYRMPQAMKASAGALIGTPDPEASLDTFVSAIYIAAQGAGVALPTPSEGLSFWNRVPGIICLLLLMLIVLAFAAAAVFAMFSDGEMPSHGSRYGPAIVLLLPFGVGYVLMKSLRRRWAVLRGRTIS
jgi:hypothetical protein